MREHKQNLANLNRNQPPDNSLKSENNLQNLTEQSSISQTANSATKVTDEAVDVLSLMAFKL